MRLFFKICLPEGYYRGEIDSQGTYHLASKISISRASLDWVPHTQLQEFRGWSDHPQTGVFRNYLTLHSHVFHTLLVCELFLNYFVGFLVCMKHLLKLVLEIPYPRLSSSSLSQYSKRPFQSCSNLFEECTCFRFSFYQALFIPCDL